jgi:capsular exopolysaccharide synthesis family protein
MNIIFYILLITFIIWYLRLDKPKFQTFRTKFKSFLKTFNTPQSRIIRGLKEESPVVQAHNKMADSLFLDRLSGKYHKIFLLTSANPKEGTTTTAINLALTLAKREKKVLLINADLRNPNVDRCLNVENTPGLMELLSENLPLEDVLKIVSGLWVIPAGSLVEPRTHPVELFKSEEANNLFKRLREEFDIVLIDSPCIKAYRDALVLSSLVDAVMLVVEANKTPKRAILMAQKKIEDVKGNLQEIILNKQINPVPFFIQDLLR